MKTLILTAIFSFLTTNALQAETGILILAHGTTGHGSEHHGDPQKHGDSHMHSMGCDQSKVSGWEQAVLDAVEIIRSDYTEPLEVAFGMWNSDCFQAGIDRLTERREIDELLVVPLFISSHSLVIETQKYIFKQRQDMPVHFPGVYQVNFNGKIQYLSAIDYHPAISEMIVSRASSLLEKSARDLSNSELILVMHGPVSEENNHLWLAQGHRYASDVAKSLSFAEIHIASLRDDAKRMGDDYAWDRAKESLRYRVLDAAKRGHSALILPLLVSAGGIEKDIHHRLEGLDYVWLGQMLLPDNRITHYLNDRIRASLNKE